MVRSGTPLCGDYYRSGVPGGAAEALLVLSEDPWNERVDDVVAVPIFKSGAAPTRLCPELAPGLIADCTLARSVNQDYLEERLGTCPDEPWTRIRMGVRIHLDIDNRIKKTPMPAAQINRTEWWPHQNDIRFAEYEAIPQGKMFGVVTNDQWNSRESTTYCSAVRLTSKSKEWREGWEVEVDGGWVVSSDLYVVRYDLMDESPPEPPQPDHLRLDQSAEISSKQKKVLTLK